MKKVILGIGVFMLTASVIISYPLFQTAASAKTLAPNNKPFMPVASQDQPLIQLAILLDTSGSMSGLINQAREQLWQVVNQFATSKKDGVTPKLEVAVYEYGNSGLSSQTGYIRQVTALTSELDEVSQGLFALNTNGGDEYCGYVIQTAVNQLAWSKNRDAVKMIFIAGNEEFSQGPVPFTQAIALAKRNGITVNTIHAGDAGSNELDGWKKGAVLAGGNFMRIDHNMAVVHYNAPQDSRLAELNEKLNQTYIPYGSEGKEKAQRQILMDKKNKDISSGLMAKRAISKASKMYSNEKWDLVDAMKDGKVDLDNIEKNVLPQAMRSMKADKQKAYVKEKAKKREALQEEILQLSKQRDQYISRKRKEHANSEKSMDDALSEAVIGQAKAKGYRF